MIGTVNDMQRVAAQGGTVSLGSSGAYSVYYEGPGASTGNIPSFTINVRPARKCRA